MPYGKILVDQIESSTGKVLNTGQVASELNAIARSLNVADSAVIYSTDTATALDDVLYIYDAPTQTTWGVPVLSSTGKTIVSVVGSDLTTTGGTGGDSYILSNDGRRYTVDTVADLPNLPRLVGARVDWMGYTTIGDGGSNWGVIKSGSHTADGGSIFSVDSNTYIESNLKGSRVNFKKFGGIGGGSVDNLQQINNIIAYTKSVYIPRDSYFFSGTINLEQETSICSDKQSLYKTLSYSTEFIFPAGVDAFSIQNKFGTSIDYIKISSQAPSGTNTATAIKYKGATCGLVSSLNVTIEDFQTGIDFGESGSFSWFIDWGHVGIYKCDVGVIFDGSNGGGHIGDLHIDANGGWTGASRRGVVLKSSNGILVDNLSIENTHFAIESTVDFEENSRIMITHAYLENNTGRDISANGDGSIHMGLARFAYFLTASKSESIKTIGSCSASVYISSLILKGESDGTDGLVRMSDLDSEFSNLYVDLLDLQSACDITPAFDSGVSPSFIRLKQNDKNSNSIVMKRENYTVSDWKMIVETERSSTVVQPDTDTFVLDLVDGTTLDLKTNNLSVVYCNNPGTSIAQWVWNGAAFDSRSFT